MMQYKFEPIRIWRVKKDRLFRFNFNLSSEDMCRSSYGINIFIQITLLRFNLSLCLKPIGELIRN